MKKRIIILGCVVVAVVVLWSAAWLVLAGVVKQNVLALAEADGITTPSLSCEALSVGGFPFRFDVDCVTARIVSGDIVVDVPGIRASIRVYAPFHMLASAKGPLQLTDSFTGTRNGVAWSTLEASIRLDNWRIARASVSGADLVWTDALFGDAVIAQSPLVEVHLFDIPEQHDAERHLAALALYARADTVAWPGLTLSDTNAEVQLELSGLPDDVRTWGDPMLLAAMQQAGGKLNIVSVHGTDATSTLDASGEMRLDPQGQLDGEITVASTGVAERIGPLLQEPWRTLVLGSPRPDGSHANQINFRAGAMFSGLVPIAAVPPLF
ncbi:DUF2125 domain-containing protein [Devosia sp. Root635]|uniref:DUF2125 domain-containing protein n=1 Tax=Devosia sp. Root635 TaxID=1736575 RepID=UPI0006FF1DE7|nr:DUF2125 domain-containing protein [Devosia sp. Root635]KRA44753.1 hypothetical protein ASD80_06340 [Devosia sp. Root635]